MLRRLLLVAVMVAVAVPVTASPCWACTCASSGDPSEDRRRKARSADFIFTGVAKKVRVDDPSPGDGIGGDETIYVRFRVGKVYKGRDRDRATINTGRSGDSCRYGFEKGKRYTVFAYKHNRKFHTNICTGTKRGRINPDNYGLDD